MQVILCFIALLAVQACGGENTQQYSIKTALAEASQLDDNELQYMKQVCDACSFKLNAKSTEAAAIALYNSQLKELTDYVQDAFGQVYSRKGHKASVNIQLVDPNDNVIKTTLVSTDTSQGGYSKQNYSIALVISNVGTMTDEQQLDLATFCKENGDIPEKPMTEEDAIKYYDQSLDSFKTILQIKLNMLKKAGAEGVAVDIQLLNEKGEVVKSDTVSI